MIVIYFMIFYDILSYMVCSSDPKCQSHAAKAKKTPAMKVTKAQAATWFWDGLGFAEWYCLKIF